ncbi:rho GTPase activating protein [Pelomyxa schiedti]|nr:rho GTPase activating protein [Pelomyxa schiedti]
MSGVGGSGAATTGAATTGGQSATTTTPTTTSTTGRSTSQPAAVGGGSGGAAQPSSGLSAMMSAFSSFFSFSSAPPPTSTTTTTGSSSASNARQQQKPSTTQQNKPQEQKQSTKVFGVPMETLKCTPRLHVSTPNTSTAESCKSIPAESTPPTASHHPPPSVPPPPPPAKATPPPASTAADLLLPTPTDTPSNKSDSVPNTAELPQVENHPSPAPEKETPPATTTQAVTDTDEWTMIPDALRTLVEYFYANESRLKIEGCFRVASDRRLMQAAKDTLDKGEAFDFAASGDPHLVSSLLKAFFREQPEPLLTMEMYDMFLAVNSLPEEEMRVQKIKHVLSFLSPQRFQVLKYILQLLIRITEHSDVNKMTPENIAIVFGPNLLRPMDVSLQLQETGLACSFITFLLTHYKTIFS